MRLLYNSALTVAATLLLLASCSSTTNNDTPTAPEEWNDKPFETKSILDYNPKNGDKRITF